MIRAMHNVGTRRTGPSIPPRMRTALSPYVDRVACRCADRRQAHARILYVFFQLSAPHKVQVACLAQASVPGATRCASMLRWSPPAGAGFASMCRTWAPLDDLRSNPYPASCTFFGHPSGILLERDGGPRIASRRRFAAPSGPGTTRIIPTILGLSGARALSSLI